MSDDDPPLAKLIDASHVTQESADAAESATDQADAERSSGDEIPTSGAYLRDYTRCPNCDATRFVARQLVYEERSYDDAGRLTGVQPTIRAELEFACGDCGTRLREMPANQRDFYGEVTVLRADLDAAVHRRVACWIATVRDRLSVL